MSTSDWIAYWNGRFVPDGEITIAPTDRGFILGDAAFEAARTYRHRPFHLDWHFDRLFTSLEYLRLDPGLSRARFEELTQVVLDRNRPVLLIAQGDLRKGQTGLINRLRQRVVAAPARANKWA